MSIKIGEVISVKGIKVVLKVFDELNKDTLFFEGDKYKGVSIREYLKIQRGFRDIVCLVEGEYLDESKFEESENKVVYTRKVEVRPIGFFEHNEFNEGVKYLPMIKDPVYLMREQDISSIYSKPDADNFVIGKMLKEEISVSIPWKKVFNTHIGIFGNTGSGKSNTLTKIYSTLFDEKSDYIKNKSQFVFLDFNGEYTKKQLLDSPDKIVFDLNSNKGSDLKFQLSENEFWDVETLSILFKATENCSGQQKLDTIILQFSS